jgi:hypothetical protein
LNRKQSFQPWRKSESRLSTTTNALLQMRYCLRRLAQHGLLLSVQCKLQITLGSIRKRLRARGSPALAFGIHYSVFKERQAHTLRRWCRFPVARITRVPGTSHRTGSRPPCQRRCQSGQCDWRPPRQTGRKPRREGWIRW